MTEKEKMLSGQTYYARDPELIKLHKDCRKSLKKLNSITSDKHLNPINQEQLVILYSSFNTET